MSINLYKQYYKTIQNYYNKKKTNDYEIMWKWDYFVQKKRLDYSIKLLYNDTTWLLNDMKGIRKLDKLITTLNTK